MITRIFFTVLIFGMISCKHNASGPNYYKNLYTNKTLSESEFQDFKSSLYSEYLDTIKNTKINFVFHSKIEKSDSIIQPFKYTIKVGNEYIINASEAKIFEYLNKPFPTKKLETINGDSIQIGGISEKPTLVNFWYIHCPPCVAEIPVLNKIRKKYADKVNFISITFELKGDVVNFLKSKSFDFEHVAEAENFIQEIGCNESYPQSIFIDKKGILRYIEGGIPFVDFEKKEMADGKEFENLINDLLD